jgi:hypothetical protein
MSAHVATYIGCGDRRARTPARAQTLDNRRSR